MTKVLPGTSRQVLSYMRSAWADLLQVSLAPIAVITGIGVIQIYVFTMMLEDFVALEGGGQINPALMGRIIQVYGFIALGGLLNMLIFVWFYVRIVRLYALGEKYWIGLNGTVLVAVLMTLLYGIGIYFLTIAAYLGSVIAVVIPTAILGALLVGSETAGVAIIIILVPAIMAILAFLIWFSTRFFVGLPSVALGQSPDFFRGMWNLSKGESWGVPARLALSLVVMAAVLVPVFAILMWPALAEFTREIEKIQGGQLPAPIIIDYFWALAPFQVMSMAVQIPWIWFTVLLYAEANRRFSSRVPSR